MKNITLIFCVILCVVFTCKAQSYSAIDIFEHCTSPIELCHLLHDSGAKFLQSNTNSIEKVEIYNTNYKKALNFGVYSTDFYLASFYKNNQEAKNYLNVIQKLASELKIGQFIDTNMLKKLLDNGNKSDDNLDLLLKEAYKTLEKIDSNLVERKQSYLGILLVTGAWIEATHLVLLVKKNPKTKAYLFLKERIGEQKIVLEIIIKTLELHKTQQGISHLINDLKKLNLIFSQVKIVIKKEVWNPITDAINCFNIPSRHSIDIKISDATIVAISKQVASIRNDIVE